MTPQPIDTAPKDGTVILTDCGVVRWIDLYRHGWPKGRVDWVTCSAAGVWTIDRLGRVNNQFPSLWCPLPEWMRHTPITDSGLGHYGD